LRCVGETEYVEAVAERHAATSKSVGGICAGIVGRADLTLGTAVAEVLEAHIEASPTRFRGIRELVAYDPEAYRALNIPAKKAFDPRFRAGFRQLAHLGLSCDLLCVHTMLEDVIDLAQAFPETQIIINHLGGPIGIGRFQNRRDEVFADWRRKIDALAGCQNVAMKLSGFGSDVMGLGLSNTGRVGNSVTVSAVIESYVHAAIDAFSPARCMVGSNFPVDSQSFDYGIIWNALKRLIQNYSADEQRELLSGTAKRVYRLAL
jgi:L-fuconolactonase